MTLLIRLYRAWMTFADALHPVASAAMFGALYLTVVPVFALLAALRPTDRAPGEWRPRRRRTSGADFFRRMS